MSKELAVVEITEEKAVAAYIGGGVDIELQKLRDMEKAFVPDTKTAKGRKEIASVARKVSTFKVRLDAAGKSLNESKRAEIELVNAERRKVVAECDETRDRIRKPLTDWEAAEELRIAAEKLAAEIVEAEEQAHYAHDMWLREREIERKEAEAEAAHAEELRIAAEKQAAAETERVEAERKAAEELRIEEARKQAAIDAEESAARQVKEAQEAAEEARCDALKAQIERELAAERAEEEKKQAIIDAELASKKAVKEAQEAEQRKQLAKEKAEADAQAKLEANKKHVSSILKAAKEGIMATGVTEEVAKQIVIAIKNGSVPNVSINY